MAPFISWRSNYLYYPFFRCFPNQALVHLSGRGRIRKKKKKPATRNFFCSYMRFISNTSSSIPFPFSQGFSDPLLRVGRGRVPVSLDGCRGAPLSLRGGLVAETRAPRHHHCRRGPHSQEARAQPRRPRGPVAHPQQPGRAGGPAANRSRYSLERP